MPSPIHERIAHALNVKANQVTATITLLDDGATVPFIARYRKEVTGGLDDTQLRELENQLTYMRELDERRTTILETIEAQGKLDAKLRSLIDAADTKQRLEDLYLPYKIKRRTKAEIAREAGLEKLADALLTDPTLNPESEAANFICKAFTTDAGENPGIADAKTALEGARAILMERFSEDAELLGQLRDHQWQNGLLTSSVIDAKESEGAKFRDYFDYAEPIAKVPPHRTLALLRGRAQGYLKLALKLPEELDDKSWSAQHGPCEKKIAAYFDIKDLGRAADSWLAEVVRLTWRAKLAFSIETTLLSQLRETAEAEAIHVFANNLKDLLLAAPAGTRTTMGLDPGIRTGVKVAVVDAQGKLLDTATVYPFAPRNDVQGSVAQLAALAERHQVELVAIGNGTASRETDALVDQLRAEHPQLNLQSVLVSEAGASVYSASEFAAREFPDLDVSLRGAVSIARRLQDPMAELVKIDPQSIGVGQYQHDVSQTLLARSLDAVVEDCVNRVGVDVNTASAPLLARVAGLSNALAENVVSFRNTQGAFINRKALLKVPRLGAKAFEQAAGFLRISGGDNPLDTSAVHPEAYPVVERILQDLGTPMEALLKQPEMLKAANAEHYTDERFGLATVQDIFSELEKPGRDPRGEFKTASFKEGVNTLSDLKPDMALEGVITNVTNFGAFVDIGVHQDGLVHISMLADRFVKDPHEVVKTGDVVRVKVLEVDIPRKRIGLSMRMGDKPTKDHSPDTSKTKATNKQRNHSGKTRVKTPREQKPQGAMANAFADALKKKR